MPPRNDLSEVEVNPERSNQHEFQATMLVRAFLGETSERRTIPTRFVYLADDAEPLSVNSRVTYYDSRVNQQNRNPEYRLYYAENEVTMTARAGDVLLFGLLNDGSAIAVVAREGSTFSSQLLWLFDLTIESSSFVVSVPEAFEGALTPFDADVLLDALGIEVELATQSDFELVTA